MSEKGSIRSYQESVEKLRAELADREAQIDKLANFIMAEVPGEPSQDQGAVDTAIRLIRTLMKEAK